MPTMTQTVLSDCSYPESTVYNIRDEIEATITRLKVVIDEEASLRKALRTLFVKRKEEAIEQVRLANLHLCLVNEEETAFCEDLKQATAIANEGSVSSASVMTRETTKPTVLPVLTGTPKDDIFPINSHNRDQEPPQSPRKSTCGLTEDGHGDGKRPSFDEPLQSPARSMNPFGPPTSPGHSVAGIEPTLSRSPAQTAHRDDVPAPNSPAWYNRKFHDDIPHHSLAPSAGGLHDSHFSPDAPSHSQRTPEMNQTSLPADPFGENCGPTIEAPEKIPVREPPPTPAPREPPAVVVVPKKKKKGKKRKEPVAEFLAPETPAVDADAEERAMMEERRQAEEDKLELELKQIEAEEAELAEQEKLEEARLIAEAAESERLELERRQDQIERQRHSQRTPEMNQTSLPADPFGGNYRSGIQEPEKSRARPSATLPTTFSFGGGGFGTGPTADSDFGFGASPTTNTGFAFGAPSQSLSSNIGFGAASLVNTGFGFGGTSQTSPTINIGLRPHHSTFESNISSFGATTQPADAEDLDGGNELFITDEAPFVMPDDEDDIVEYDAEASVSSRVQSSRYGPRDDQRSYGSGLRAGPDTPSMYSQQTGKPRLLPLAIFEDRSARDEPVLSSRLSASTTAASMHSPSTNMQKRSPTEPIPIPELKPRQLTEAEMYKLSKLTWSGGIFNLMSPTKKQQPVPGEKTSPSRNPFRF